jgi:polyisoprenoid-binding protein YceI
MLLTLRSTSRRSRRLLFAFALGGAVSLGCDNDPVKSKARAEVAEAVKSVPAPAAAAATYSFSQDDSKLEFVGAKVTGKHDGGFKTFRGTIRVPDGKVENGSVEVEIESSSVYTDNEKLTGHLKSADFFETEKFPKARFTSTKVQPGGAGGATHTITGNLELHGVTKSISFPAKVQASGDQVTVETEFGINRKDFGILYTGKADDLIKDDVLIKLNIRARKVG